MSAAEPIRSRITGAAGVAGVVGSPIAHSLSPALHGAWIDAAGLDAVYAPFAVDGASFERFIDGLRGGVVRGLNVTAPFKTRAAALADIADASAATAGAANLLLFDAHGTLEARNTDGLGLLHALAQQAPALSLSGARVVLLGAGGGARGAGAILIEAGVTELRLVNRTPERARELADALGATAWPWSELDAALEGCDLLINATPPGAAPPDTPLHRLRPGAAVMDMTYRPLRTPLLVQAEHLGLTPVDGLAMLIGQAIPSFEVFFGRPPPSSVDARAVALEAMR